MYANDLTLKIMPASHRQTSTLKRASRAPEPSFIPAVLRECASYDEISRTLVIADPSLPPVFLKSSSLMPVREICRLNASHRGHMGQDSFDYQLIRSDGVAFLVRVGVTFQLVP